MRVVFLLAVTGLFLSSCESSPESRLCGTWNRTDDRGNQITIQFSENGDYRLFVNGKDLLPPETTPTRYEITQLDPVVIELYEPNSNDQLARLVGDFEDKKTLKLSTYYNDQPLETIVLHRN